MSLIPVVIFTYKRVDSLRRCVESLLACDEFGDFKLIIYSDGPRGELDKLKVKGVRDYLVNLQQEVACELRFSEINKGLAKSIIEGVGATLAEFGSVIVLEDDLVLSRDFLSYMRTALERFRSEPKVFSISGYSIPCKKPETFPFSGAFHLRPTSWGWATWADRWERVDWDVKEFKRRRWSFLYRHRFNRGGADLSRMMNRQLKGEIDSWAVRWAFAHYFYGALAAVPLVSKVRNEGFGEDGTHCKVEMQPKIDMSFNDNVDSVEWPQEIVATDFYVRSARARTSIINKLRIRFNF